MKNSVTARGGRRPAFASLLLMCAMLAALAPHAHGEDLRALMIGKWRNWVGNIVTETVFQGNGHFTELSDNRDTGVHFFREGSWEIRSGKLWERNENWEPKENYGQKIVLPDSELIVIDVIDHDHVRINHLVTASRVN